MAQHSIFCIRLDLKTYLNIVGSQFEELLSSLLERDHGRQAEKVLWLFSSEWSAATVFLGIVPVILHSCSNTTHQIQPEVQHAKCEHTKYLTYVSCMAALDGFLRSQLY